MGSSEIHHAMGDQIVRIVVETPVKLSRKQKDLLREFDELADNKTYPNQHKFTEEAEKGYS